MTDMRDYFGLPHPEMGTEPTDRELRAFMACSNLLAGMYRLGEYRRVLDELDYVTDDFVREIVDDVADPPTVRRVEGKEAMRAQSEQEAATLPTDHRFWRTHTLEPSVEDAVRHRSRVSSLDGLLRQQSSGLLRFSGCPAGS